MLACLTAEDLPSSTYYEHRADEGFEEIEQAALIEASAIQRRVTDNLAARREATLLTVQQVAVAEYPRAMRAMMDAAHKRPDDVWAWMGVVRLLREMFEEPPVPILPQSGQIRIPSRPSVIPDDVRSVTVETSDGEVWTIGRDGETRAGQE